MPRDPFRYVDAAEQVVVTKTCKPFQILSTGVKLHVDWYPQTDRFSPAVVINHGGGGHAGLFARLALRFHALGYAVAVPDQRGQGRSGGTRGDFAVPELVQNILDVCSATRLLTSGPVFMIGSSIGGGLTYAAAAESVSRGTTPAAIACVNLYDFGDPRTGLEFSRAAWLGRSATLAHVLRSAGRLLAQKFPNVRLPYRLVANFSHMLDERDLRDGAYERWAADPLALKSVTLRALVSLMNTPACIPFSDNTEVPVLVINPIHDRMVRPEVTKRSFDQLGGPRLYQEIPFGHYSLRDEFGVTVASLAHDWFRSHC